MTEEEPEITHVLCGFCGAQQEPGYKFCGSCGRQNSVQVEKRERRQTTISRNIRFVSFYALFTIGLLVIMAFFDDSFTTLLVWTLLFAVIDLVFAFYQPIVWRLFDLRKTSIVLVLASVLIGIVTSLIVSSGISELNLILFDDPGGMLGEVFITFDNPILMSAIFMGAFPAVFEELAFRGFVFTSIEKFGGKNAAVWGSTFLFAIVHFSLISILWIIPFGLLLAWLRTRYNTLVYGIIIHFTHNTMVCTLEYYGYFV